MQPEIRHGGLLGADSLQARQAGTTDRRRRLLHGPRTVARPALPTRTRSRRRLGRGGKPQPLHTVWWTCGVPGVASAAVIPPADCSVRAIRARPLTTIRG